MKRLILVFAVLLLAPTGAKAQVVKDVTIKNFGIFAGESVTGQSGFAERKSVLLRETNVISKDDWKHRFGVEYTINGDPGAHIVCHENVYRSGRPSASLRFYRETNASYQSLLQYNPAFDKRELTIEIECGGRKASKTFTLQ